MTRSLTTLISFFIIQSRPILTYSAFESFMNHSLGLCDVIVYLITLAIYLLLTTYKQNLIEYENSVTSTDSRFTYLLLLLALCPIPLIYTWFCNPAMTQARTRVFNLAAVRLKPAEIEVFHPVFSQESGCQTCGRTTGISLKWTLTKEVKLQMWKLLSKSSKAIFECNSIYIN